MWPVVIDAHYRENAQREVAPATPIRIGDAERDEAVSSLGDHFAAGRLSRDELDQRIDQAMQAKFTTDLDPLFADLPKSEPDRIGPPQRVGGQRPGSPLFLIFPLLVVAVVIAALVSNTPQILFALVWLAVIGRFFRQRWVAPYPHGRVHRPGPPANYR
jgi:hypothetical protein